MDDAIHGVILCLVDSAVRFVNIYQLDTDLPSGYCYLPFENGYWTWYVLVCIKVRIWRTEQHIPTQISGGNPSPPPLPPPPPRYPDPRSSRSSRSPGPQPPDFMFVTQKPYLVTVAKKACCLSCSVCRLCMYTQLGDPANIHVTSITNWSTANIS